MTSTYTPNTPGPWLVDDDNVLVDGVTYLGTLYPYGQTLPTLDGTYPNPSAIETATGRLASLATTGALQTLHSTGHLPFPLVHRGIYDPDLHATGKANTYTAHGVLSAHTARGVLE